MCACSSNLSNDAHCYMIQTPWSFWKICTFSLQYEKLLLFHKTTICQKQRNQTMFELLGRAKGTDLGVERMKRTLRSGHPVVMNL